MFADFVDRADVRMVQGRCGTSLPPKSLKSLWVSRYLIGQEFQGYKSPKLGVLGLVHHSHATTAQLFEDAVVGDGLADELGECGHWLGMLSGHKGKVNADHGITAAAPSGVAGRCSAGRSENCRPKTGLP